MNLSSKLLRICTGVQAAAIIAISMPVSTSQLSADFQSFQGNDNVSLESVANNPYHNDVLSSPPR